MSNRCLSDFLSVSQTNGTTLKAISLELYIEKDVQDREIPFQYTGFRGIAQIFQTNLILHSVKRQQWVTIYLSTPFAVDNVLILNDSDKKHHVSHNHYLVDRDPKSFFPTDVQRKTVFKKPALFWEIEGLWFRSLTLHDKSSLKSETESKVLKDQFFPWFWIFLVLFLIQRFYKLRGSSLKLSHLLNAAVLIPVCTLAFVFKEEMSSGFTNSNSELLLSQKESLRSLLAKAKRSEALIQEQVESYHKALPIRIEPWLSRDIKDELYYRLESERREFYGSLKTSADPVDSIASGVDQLLLGASKICPTFDDATVCEHIQMILRETIAKRPYDSLFWQGLLEKPEGLDSLYSQQTWLGQFLGRLYRREGLDILVVGDGWSASRRSVGTELRAQKAFVQLMVKALGKFYIEEKVSKEYFQLLMELKQELVQMGLSPKLLDELYSRPNRAVIPYDANFEGAGVAFSWSMARMANQKILLMVLHSPISSHRFLLESAFATEIREGSIEYSLDNYYRSPVYYPYAPTRNLKEALLSTWVLESGESAVEIINDNSKLKILGISSPYVLDFGVLKLKKEVSRLISENNEKRWLNLLYAIFSVFLVSTLINLLLSLLNRPLQRLQEDFGLLASGEFPNRDLKESKIYEIQSMQKSWFDLVRGLREREEFLKFVDKSSSQRILKGQGQVLTQFRSILYASYQPREDLLESWEEFVCLTQSVVFECKGEFDKFTGNACLASFDPELVEADFCYRLLSAFERSNLEGQITLSMRTGDMSLGAVGARERLDFTSIGDLVNATARMNSHLKSQSLTDGVVFGVDRETWELYNPNLDPEEDRVLKNIMVKGKEESLEILLV